MPGDAEQTDSSGKYTFGGGASAAKKYWPTILKSMELVSWGFYFVSVIITVLSMEWVFPVLNENDCSCVSSFGYIYKFSPYLVFMSEGLLVTHLVFFGRKSIHEMETT